VIQQGRSGGLKLLDEAMIAVSGAKLCDRHRVGLCSDRRLSADVALGRAGYLRDPLV
jgi:hypothetical protein